MKAPISGHVPSPSMVNSPDSKKKSAFKEEFTMATYPPEKAGQPGAHALPTRGTGASDDAVPDVDPTDTAGILLERLQAWKHACGNLEDYITATEKLQKAHAKEYEKVLKSISNPLREGHHFDQSLGGIAGLFENMRSNTQGIADSHLETSKALTLAVLPILTALHSEIKAKNKDITNGAAKGAKAVAVSQNTTQKHIELLGQHSATYDAAGAKVEPHYDPYVLKRGIQYRLNKQVMEENNNRQELLRVQDDFQKFEAHVVQTIQRALGEFLKYVSSQADKQKAFYTDVVGTSQRIPLEFEWMNFLHRSGNYMVDPATPARSMKNIAYPNEEHASTKPLIEGTLERKSRAMGGLTGFKSGYYIVTPSKYLHQFEDNDNFKKDPTPDLSLYLPDCTIGALSGEKFNIKGKDASKGKVGGAFQMTHELSFKAQSTSDAQKWYSIIHTAVGSTDNDLTSPTSPTASHGLPLQTQNLPAGDAPASAGPQSAAPKSAVGASPATAVNPATATSPTVAQNTTVLGKETAS